MTISRTPKGTPAGGQFATSAKAAPAATASLVDEPADEQAEARQSLLFHVGQAERGWHQTLRLGDCPVEISAGLEATVYRPHTDRGLVFDMSKASSVDHVMDYVRDGTTPAARPVAGAGAAWLDDHVEDLQERLGRQGMGAAVRSQLLRDSGPRLRKMTSYIGARQPFTQERHGDTIAQVRHTGRWRDSSGTYDEHEVDLEFPAYEHKYDGGYVVSSNAAVDGGADVKRLVEQTRPDGSVVASWKVMDAKGRDIEVDNDLMYRVRTLAWGNWLVEEPVDKAGRKRNIAEVVGERVQYRDNGARLTRVNGRPSTIIASSTTRKYI